MEEKLINLIDIDKTMLSEVGGKGANLGELIKAGFPVPPGFSLTTKVYEDFVGNEKINDLEAEEAREILERKQLSKEVSTLIQEALKDYSDDTLFSIRSSATSEDLPFASFAGQQDTYLNIKKDDIEKFVKKCFISLFTDRAVSYRRENNITNSKMAVIVQKMINSDKSGVMFTADPITGNRNKLVIDAIFGLGEAIVSGLVTPDHLIINKNLEKIEDKTIETKSFALKVCKDGGTVKEILDSKEEVLDQYEIKQLSEVGKKLENYFNAPQDIEWAIEDNKLYILQTRNITSLYPKPVFEDNKFHFLFNMGYQQMNPVAMPVLSLELLKGATNFHRFPLPDYKSTIIYSIGQHAFLDLSSVLFIRPIQKIFVEKAVTIMDPLAQSAIEELLARKEKLSHPDTIIFKKIIGGFSQIPKYLTSNEPKKLVNEVITRLEEKSKDLEDSFQNSDIDKESLIELFDQLYIGDFFIKDFVPMIFSGIISLKLLELTEEKVNKKGEWTQFIQHGNEGNVVSEMNLDLGDLADLLIKDKSLKADIEKAISDIDSYLKNNNNNFIQQFKSFLNKYGHRGAGELDIYNPRWKEKPELVIEQILSLSENKTLGSHRIEYLENLIKAKEATSDFIEEVKKKLGPKRAVQIASLIERYRTYYPLRESFKFYWMKYFGIAKEYLLKVGANLVLNNQVEEIEDIFHLTLPEIYNALDSNQDLRDLIEKRKLEYQRVLKLNPPRILTSDGEVLMGGITKENIPENALPGLGVSPGKTVGIANVVLDPNGSQIEEGEILVAPFTDPGWTPLFINAKALVTEVGGALTHGSIVAREYGIPGVVGIQDVTKKIKSGQRILVDGTSGYIEILED